MALDEKIKILGKLRGGMSTAAVGITFRLYFTLMLNFQMILYYITVFVHR
jgi:hypothetical protein